MPWLAVTARSAGDLLARHDAGIGVRQQAGLAQHQAAHRGEILDGGGVAQRRQRIARRLVAQLRLVAQGEQRLGAARRLAGAGDGEHLVGRQVGRLAGPRPLGEGAVVADVAAQVGQRNEDLARIRDQPAVAAIAQSRRVRHQPGKLRHDQPSQERSCPNDSGNRRRPHRVVWPVTIRSDPGRSIHEIRLQRTHRRADVGGRATDQAGRRGRGHGLRLRHLQRPCRDPDRHRRQIPLQQHR